MKHSGQQLIEQLRSRGLVAQVSGDEELESHLDQPQTVYCGFDPTADSLHLGHLVPLLVLKRFQEAGHTPIALVGGATGMIGDPSFKADERKLNTPDVIAGWADKIKNQVSQFIDFDCGDNSAVVANNLDWTAEMTALDFLRDVGKHFSVNNMIAKESVKQRIDREGSGISFTEFAYSLLQGLDFAELNRRYNCTLQVGGSDQWGNIVNGIDLIRRDSSSEVYGLTTPLLTNAKNEKMGKTVDGAVWLNEEMLTPYDYWQFWRNVDDRDVFRFLKLFTDKTLEEIKLLENDTNINNVKILLANAATEMLHGKEKANLAEKTANDVFKNEGSSENLPLINVNLTKGKLSLNDLIVEIGFASSKSETRKLIKNNGVKINKALVIDELKILSADDFDNNNEIVVSVGKKKHFIIKNS